MTITAKDFAQKMIEWYEDQSGTDSTAQAAELAADLGLTLAPEKPEPGTWHVVKDGDYEGYPARVFSRMELHIFHPTGAVHSITKPGLWPALTPARVAPAEPVELSERQVGELYDDQPGSGSMPWDEVSGATRMTQGKLGRLAVTSTVNAALAKHGHGRAPHQSTIEDALRVGLKGTGEELSPEARQQAADAVYQALLGGGDRG